MEDNLKESLILLSKVKEELEEYCCQASLDATNLAYDIEKLFRKMGIEDNWQNRFYKRHEESEESE